MHIHLLIHLISNPYTVYTTYVLNACSKMFTFVNQCNWQCVLLVSLYRCSLVQIPFQLITTACLHKQHFITAIRNHTKVQLKGY